MGVKKAISEYRPVLITFTDGGGDGIPVDAYKAALGVVERVEGEYQKTGVFADLSDAPVLATGTLPYQIFVFDVTTVIATGTYTFDYTETRPNTVV